MSGLDHELSRLCMAADGRIKAQFNDNSILLLSPNGRTFTHIDKDGNVMRQLSDCAISRHLVPLAIAIEFRNLHVANPSFCSKLKTPREVLVLGFCMSDLYWPMSIEEAEAKCLFQCSQDDGKITVGTEDGCGQIVLHQNQRRFGISYPLLIRDLPKEGAWEYVWQTQVFSLLSFPQRWEPIVSLVLKAARELVHADEGRPEPADESSGRMADEWERREAFYASSPSGRRTELPQALEGGYGSNPGSCAEDYCTTEGWWSEPTLALLPEDLLVMEWTPQATYQFHPMEPYEVEAWVHEDESCLSTLRQGRYLAHHRPSLSKDNDGRPGAAAAAAGPTEQVYAAEAVPESFRSTAVEGGRYSLAPIAAHATKFRQQMAAQLVRASRSAYGPLASADLHTKIEPISIISGLPLPRPHSFADLPSSLVDPAAGAEGALILSQCDHGASLDPEWAFAVSSDVVVEEEVVPQQGTFTAYADGRLRCFFEDRTILHMDPSRTYCKMLMSDGARVIVTVENPVGVEAYVQAAASFAVWAFKSQEEREREAKERAMAEAEVAASMRMAQILEWTTAKHSSSSSHPPNPVNPPNPHQHHQNDQNRGGPATETNLAHGANGNPTSSSSASGFTPEDVEAMLRRNRELVEKLLI